jgi:hypothetical protein
LSSSSGRGLLIGWLAWTADAILYAVILTLQAKVFFLYSLSGSLVSHYVMAIYSVPIWFWTTHVLAEKRWPAARKSR